MNSTNSAQLVKNTGHGFMAQCYIFLYKKKAMHFLLLSPIEKLNTCEAVKTKLLCFGFIEGI